MKDGASVRSLSRGRDRLGGIGWRIGVERLGR